MYGIVTPIKDGNDTLYKKVDEFWGDKYTLIYYTDGEYAYEVDESVYGNEGGFITASSYAENYEENVNSTYHVIMSASSVEEAVEYWCGDDVTCAAYFPIEYYAVKTSVDGNKNYEIILDATNRTITYIWKAKFSDKYTMDDFTDAFAKHSCAGEEYYPQEKFCRDGKTYEYEW